MSLLRRSRCQERPFLIWADIVPNGSPRYYIVPLGSFWSPWGIAGHPRPQIGTFGILTILPSTGGAGALKIFFSPNAPQLLRAGRGVLCGHKPRFEAPPTALFCPLGQNVQVFSPKGKKTCTSASNGQKNAVGCNLRSALAKRPLTSSLTKKQGGKTPRNRLDMGASRTYFSVIFVLSAHLALIERELDVNRPGQHLCSLRGLGP